MAVSSLRRVPAGDAVNPIRLPLLDFLWRGHSVNSIDTHGNTCEPGHPRYGLDIVGLTGGQPVDVRATRAVGQLPSAGAFVTPAVRYRDHADYEIFVEVTGTVISP